MINKIIPQEMRIITFFSIFAVILVVFMSLVNRYHIYTLHQVTQDIYEHPLKVSSAALMLQNSILKIHTNMKDIHTNLSQSELKKLIKDIHDEEKEIDKYLKIIQANILGSKGVMLYESTYKLFNHTKIIHRNMIHAYTNKSLYLTPQLMEERNNGHFEVLNTSSLQLYHYAQNRANTFTNQAEQIFIDYKLINLLFMIFTIALFSAFIFYIKDRIKKYMLNLTQKEIELENLNERLEYAINATGDGLWDWNLVTNEVYFSPQWKEMLGYTDSELANNFDSWKLNVHPNDLELATKGILQAQVKPNTPYENIHRLKHKDGSWVWILDRGQTMFDESGKAVRMIGFHTDITRLKEEEKKNKNLSLLLHNIINSVDSLLFVKDSNYRYIECNPAFERFIGKSRDELIGHDDYDFFPKEQADFFQMEDKKMITSKKMQSSKNWVPFADGSKHYLLTQTTPLMNEDNQIIGLVGTSIDLTQEQKLEDELNKKEEIMIAQSRHAAMGEMISMIAHQWRQPISVIAMDANNILADIELDMLEIQELDTTLKGIIAQTQELSKTIDDFRNFFKPDKAVEDVLLSDVLDNAFQVIGKSLENNNIDVKFTVDKSLHIQTYSRELMQVLINIIKNAKEVLLEKEIHEKSVIINVYKKDERVYLQICDNAGGIKNGNLGKIFNPYFTTKGEKNGTGLGLYMSKTIIEKHLGGNITAYNKENGACFEIQLPIRVKTDG